MTLKTDVYSGYHLGRAVLLTALLFLLVFPDVSYSRELGLQRNSMTDFSVDVTTALKRSDLLKDDYLGGRVIFVPKKTGNQEVSTQINSLLKSCGTCMDVPIVSEPQDVPVIDDPPGVEVPAKTTTVTEFCAKYPGLSGCPEEGK